MTCISQFNAISEYYRALWEHSSLHSIERLFADHCKIEHICEEGKREFEGKKEDDVLKQYFGNLLEHCMVESTIVLNFSVNRRTVDYSLLQTLAEFTPFYSEIQYSMTFRDEFEFDKELKITKLTVVCVSKKQVVK